MYLEFGTYYNNSPVWKKRHLKRKLINDKWVGYLKNKRKCFITKIKPSFLQLSKFVITSITYFHTLTQNLRQNT